MNQETQGPYYIRYRISVWCCGKCNYPLTYKKTPSGSTRPYCANCDKFRSRRSQTKWSDTLDETKPIEELDEWGFRILGVERIEKEAVV